eukprot:c45335_g1_i1 orf=147-311(+)
MTRTRTTQKRESPHSKHTSTPYIPQFKMVSEPNLTSLWPHNQRIQLNLTPENSQ